jgi:hypothetical protein
MAQQYQEKGVSQDVEGDVKDLRKGGEIEGIYQGSKSFDGRRPGEINVLHYFKQGEKVFGCWGAKDLNEKLAGEIGKMVKCSFKEKKQLKDGRSKNIFQVLVAG